MTVVESGSPKYTVWNMAIRQAIRTRSRTGRCRVRMRFKGMSARIRSIRTKYACGDQFLYFLNLRNCSRGDATCGLTGRKPGVCATVYLRGQQETVVTSS